ncbi:MAG: cytochrome ubiquinol oxidase subunit I [Propionibacteriaceae bacterium]|jgi:cytochrome d ubiquinol oxidase subunit I|nr:cytochrome ubiquinol oxidase subunit I [Propionibacteriaceae bacterium]
MSPETVARWQFGITTVYHFLFVPLTISLSLLTAVLQTLWTKSGNAAYLRLTKFFGKLFLINFAMGVVTGIVQEFQFGMNWSEYSRFVGDIFGAPLALEALIAFFLESTFLGLWIFGWGRLSKGKHLMAIWLGSVGTLISSIFIIAANAWMQNPVGATYVNGHAELNGFSGFLAVLTNPVFLTQWCHTICASGVTGGAFMTAIALHKLIQTKKADGPDKDLKAYGIGTKLGAWVLVVAGLGTVVTGDLLGKQMVQTQPAKMAAAEGLTTIAADQDRENMPFTILPGVSVFPGFLNWLYGADKIQSTEELQAQFLANGYRQQCWVDGDCGTGKDGSKPADGQLTLQAEFADGLNAMTTGYKADAAVNPDAEDFNTIPSATIEFWTFRLMIGIGLLAVLGGLLALIVTWGGKVPKAGTIPSIMAVALPVLPLVANSFGWIFTEMGRQPWIVNGVLPTVYAISPDPTLAHSTPILLLTVVLYTVIYAALAVVEVKLLLKYIKIGLPADEDVPTVDLGGDPDAPLSFAY